MIRLSLLCCVSLLFLAVSSSPSARWPSKPDQQQSLNANHIFNTIHSSMRQFGSSLHHNGMSYFIANVPADTHLYHGRYDDSTVEGPEWLAFEPEHAHLFTSRPPRPPRLGPHLHEQRVFEAEVAKTKSATNHSGYLRTYAAKYNLRLLYIDGQSAAKSGIGTLDTQDYILVNHSVDQKKRTLGDRLRAAQMCQRAGDQWKGQIDGILRMEGGFEIILCSFKDSLTLLRMASTSVTTPEAFTDADEIFSYLQSVTARYDGNGGNRVQVDYDDFVSAYTFADAHLFRYGSKPRLNSTSAAVLEAIRGELDLMASKSRQSSTTLHDWQSVADMIVARHASRLAYITSPAMSSYSILERELDRMMKPFIDYSTRSQEEEVQRCTDEYIPSGWPMNSTAGQAIRSVSHHICTTVSDLLNTDEGKNKSLATAIKKINSLKAWLDWSTWKRCTGCSSDEICMVPMWPRGSLSDWEQPSCANKTGAFAHRGYWGPIPKF